MLKPRPLFIAGFLLLVSLFTWAQDPEQDKLPDLGEPAANTASIQPNINADGAGFSYHDNSNGSLFSIHPQYNRQNGLAIGGSLALPVGTNSAAGILLMAGEDRNEWLVNAGMDLNSNHRLIFSLGQLRQKLDFNFLSGSQKTQVTQDNAALSYQYLFGQDWLNAAEMQAYISNTDSISLSSKTYYTETADLYELWRDSYRVAGGRVTGVQGQLVLTPSTSTTIKLGFGAERLTYDYLTGDDISTRATGSAELMQRLDYGFNLRASANAGAAQSRYAVGLGKSFHNGSQLGIDITRIQGRDHSFNDSQIQLSYSQSFGGNPTASLANSSPTSDNADTTSATSTPSTPMNPASANTETSATSSNAWASALVEQVSRRPSVLPSQVMAKVDSTATPTRLIAVDKTTVPEGSSLNDTTGVITAPVDTTVGSVAGVSLIAGVTLNGAAFTNSGQFTLSGSTDLVINPNLISPPAVGVTDTYVVTMNNSADGGTTLATVMVMRGSVRIISVVISPGISTPILTGFALSAASVAFGAAAPTITAPTSASSGAITYSSSNTAVASIDSHRVITLVGVGSVTFTATQTAHANYLSATISTTSLTVTTPPPPPPPPPPPAPALIPTLTGLALSANPVAFGAAAPTITAPTSASVGAITYSSATAGVATITSAGVISIVGVGSTVITATQAADGNYVTATQAITLTVTAANQAALTANATLTSIVALTGTSTLSTSGGSGDGAVTYAVTAGLCTIAGTTLTAGNSLVTCTVTATKAAEGNFAAATGTVNITVTLPAGYITSSGAIGGYTIDGFTWAPITTTANWSTAAATCSASTALGLSDWRQPTRFELLALYNLRSSGISPAGWGPTGWTLSSTWSSSDAGGGAHYYNTMNNGGVATALDSTLYYVSCVHN